jgi:hypothetical protein
MAKTLPLPTPRRPAATPGAESLAAAEAFVTGAPTLVQSAPSAPSVRGASVPRGTKGTKPLASKRKLVPRRDGRLVRRVVAYFDPKLAKRLARYAVDHETDVSAAIVAAVRQMLAARATTPLPAGLATEGEASCILEAQDVQATNVREGDRNESVAGLRAVRRRR